MSTRGSAALAAASAALHSVTYLCELFVLPDATSVAITVDFKCALATPDSALLTSSSWRLVSASVSNEASSLVAAFSAISVRPYTIAGCRNAARYHQVSHRPGYS